MNLGRQFAKKTDKGAETLLSLASKEVEKVTGEYFVDCKIELIGSAKSEEQANKLWSVSSLTGIDLN